MAVPTAFSVSSRTFDQTPEDADLVGLLGGVDHPGQIVVVDTAELLAVRAGKIPMKFVVPWMIFICAAITAGLAPRLGGGFNGGFAWVMIGAMWLLVFPFMVALFVFSNRHFASKGDYFKVDKIRRTLQIPHLSRTVSADQIVAFTDLSRYFNDAREWALWGSWEWTRQISVLVAAPAGQVEQLPLVRVVEWQKKSLANRLAEIFQVPVRRIRLSWRQSRRLKDS